MSTTARLPKWVSLLLTLLIGAAFSFGGQLFIATAAQQPKAKGNVPQSCTLNDNAPTAGKTTAIVLGKLGTSDDDTALGKIDLTQFNLACGNNKKDKKPKA
ncbi:MAG TPA: hypothetical protein VGL94_00200 [Ktedonobacteraceae bacterium]